MSRLVRASSLGCEQCASAFAAPHETIDLSDSSRAWRKLSYRSMLRGVVLRRAELVDGEEAFVREVEQIVYDGSLPQEVFAFELPPGASARGRAEPQITTVDAAAKLASCPVFKLEPVPPEWRVQAIYVAATERPTLP